MSRRFTRQHWPWTIHAESWTDYERVTLVRVEVHVGDREVLHARASAVCHPRDKFNKGFGEDLAYARALKKCTVKLANATNKLHFQTAIAITEMRGGPPEPTQEEVEDIYETNHGFFRFSDD